MAIVGFGGMAGWHYDEIQTIEGLEIAGIWDIREERRDYAAREKGLHVYGGKVVQPKCLSVLTASKS